MQSDDTYDGFDPSSDASEAAAARDARTMSVAGRGVDPAEPHDSDGGRAGGGAADGFSWRDFLIWAGVPVVVILLLRLFVFGFYTIPSGSMLDTIEIGDRVITSKLTPRVFDLERGDVIVFKDPSNWLGNEGTDASRTEFLIKRLIGLPGDVVECAGDGQPVKVNGVAVDESSYIRPGVAPSAFPFRVEVTEGHVFVMGDNRANSADSRYHQDDGQHGLVPVDDVVGVGFARFWPLTRVGGLDAHHEVFADVPGGASSAASASKD